MYRKASPLYLWVVVYLSFLTASDVIADGYWGQDSQGGMTYTVSPNYGWGNKYGRDFLELSNEVVVDTFIIWCNGQNNYPKVVFGIYDVISGSITNRIAVSDTLSITGSAMQRWVLPADIALSAGSAYTLCLDIIGTAGPSVAYNSQASALSRHNGATFSAVWSENSTLAARYSVAAHYRDIAGSAASRRRIIIGGDK
jgi:hypothetical protein